MQDHQSLNLSHITQKIEVAWGFGASGAFPVARMRRDSSPESTPSCDQAHIDMCVLSDLLRPRTVPNRELCPTKVTWDLLTIATLAA